MTREKMACVLDSILLVSFSPAVCVEHTDDLLPVQVPYWSLEIPERQGQIGIPVFYLIALQHAAPQLDSTDLLLTELL